MNTFYKVRESLACPSEVWGEISSRVGPKLTRKLRNLLSTKELDDITQYYVAKRMWGNSPVISISDIASRVSRNYSAVRHWLQDGKRPKAVQLLESLNARDDILISWPPLKETLEELYLTKGMSTHQIAEIFEVSSSMIFRWLKKFKIPLRNRIDAYTKAVTKYAKKPFSGNWLGAAYMIGLRLSDYDARWASREGRTVSVRIGTTHPGMIQLARNVFGPHGGVVIRPRINNHGGHHWEVECHLDSSFGFLVPRPHGIPAMILDDHQTFLYCFAGLVDGDGWITLHNCWDVKAIPELGFCNTDHRLVKDVMQGLLNLGYVAKPRVDRQRGSMSSYGRLNNSALRLELKGNNAIKLLNVLPLRHPEKLMRRALALQLHGKPWKHAKAEWDKLLVTINAEREKCIGAAGCSRKSLQRQEEW